MIQRVLDLHYDELIIGADEHAVNFSYSKKIPIIYLKKKFFPFYSLGKIDELRKPRKDFERMLSVVSFCFLNPMAEMLQTIRIDSDNSLRAITKNNLSVHITFDKLYISESDGVEGLPPPVGATGDDNLVVDYINVHSGHGHDFRLLETEDDFVRRLYFHRSRRFKFIQASKKDCVAVSSVKTKDLDLYEFSENAARLKAVSVMKKAGINGRWDKTNNRHKTLRLSGRKRFIFKQWKEIYEDLPKTIKMIYDIPPVEVDLDAIIK